ncbi:hypothetical protein SAMN04488498_15213 [Mesorhizobium albiziae]|uniref:Uncharacterized protein n=1 Tax=Neomesorhizobium albiziae TaxID=335020 RepID=A0A1I4FQH2_9HYPH|nr:hypothetical protein GCM10007937_01600 [Mesorhizobium albiziae]SFL19217.1 hypothetical protein SAMN04488498_15213 [Mesorhizobium albiziae]
MASGVSELGEQELRFKGPPRCSKNYYLVLGHKNLRAQRRDRIFDLLAKSNPPQADNWPPYDIAKLGEDTYRIIPAVAGFTEDELSITHEPNLLVINGAKTENGEVLYLH